MSQRRDRVYVDTATLYPISIADLVLRLAEIGIIELVWTDYLLDETTRVLVDDKQLSRAAATPTSATASAKRFPTATLNDPPTNTSSRPA